MIILNSGGGLGNQMFTYIYAYVLSKEYNEEIVSNIFRVNSYIFLYNLFHPKNQKRFFENRLKYFECGKTTRELPFLSSLLHALKLDLVLARENILKRRRRMTSEEGFKTLSRMGFFTTRDYFSFYEHGECKKKNKYVNGLFQSERYFSTLSPNEIKKMFTPIIPPSEENRKVIEKIKSVNSVCVHIRRGDYQDRQWNFLNVCNERYYLSSFNYINANLESPKYFIFSNNAKEIKWIKENYKFIPSDSIFVDLNNCDYEELRLMYNCKHFILSNSTFSWWASYLSENKEKIVIAPDIWIRKGYLNYNASIDLYRDDMIKIHVDLEERK